MIARLQGKLVERDPGRIVVDVLGVGYEVFVPMSTYTMLSALGSDVTLDIHTHIREDILALYGFASKRERLIFEKLLTISGIGPKLAIGILSGGSVEDVVTAIKRNDLPRLTRIPGVGKKTAERIVMELRDKLQEFQEASSRPTVQVDVVSALENLGYNRAMIDGALQRASAGEDATPFDELFKRTLQILTKG